VWRFPLNADRSALIADRLMAPFGVRAFPASGRNSSLRGDDAVLVSYPRSGNTWLSFMLSNLRHPESPTTFMNLESRLPDIYLHTDRTLLRQRRPRVLKSHEPFDPRYPRVVYLVRDPRDVAISYRRFLVKMWQLDAAVSMEAFLVRFLDGTLDSFGTWGEHVGSWLGARGAGDSLLLLRYEDIRERPVELLQQAAEFLRLDATPHSCERAVELASLENMQKMERAEAAEVPELRHARRDIPFIGEGRVGGGRAELAVELQEELKAAWHRQMSDLGYL
jgi:hypothetical protein